MSKSLGNMVDPNAMVEKYGVDALRYFLFREVPFGLDGDFSEQALINRINTDLANDLGNLVSRFIAMAEKYFGGEIDIGRIDAGASSELEEQCTYAHMNIHRKEYWYHLHFSLMLENIWAIIGEANNYIARKEPWKLAKENTDQLKIVMFNIWNALRITALSLYPFMPDTAGKIWIQLGLKSLVDEARQYSPEIFEWEWKPSYEIKVFKAEHLFPRIETKDKNKDGDSICKLLTISFKLIISSQWIKARLF